jgi:protoheme IX farnesyltransferase
MKATAPTITPASTTHERSMVGMICDLVKARLTSLVLLTTLVGFYSGSSSPVDIATMIHAMLGTALVACGASALNQLLEREFDGRMRRTEKRPLPSGRMSPDTVLVIGVGLSAAGLIYLALGVNLLTSFLGAITLASYVFVYTPLKRKTTLNTVIGAIPGALPPLMGWTAAREEISIGGWSLFAILFLWQLPHFMAIAWLYREDYARGGYAMLPVLDEEGRRTGSVAISYALGLIPISLCPSLFGISGIIYFMGAFLLGVGFLYCAIQFARKMSEQKARLLFFASIIYLPLLLGLLVLDKVK